MWTDRSGGANRLVALIRYPPNVDPEELTRHVMTTTIGFALVGLIGTAIIFIGARFIIAPRVAAVGYGVQPDLGEPSAGATHLLGWVILAASIIPLADAAIVLGNGGSKSIAWGVHGLTAVVMLGTSALLLIS